MSTLTFTGVYYDGRIPVGSAATIMLAGKKVVLVGTEVSVRYDASAIRVSPQTGAASRFLALPDGKQFQCPDNPELDQLPQEVPSESLVARLERHWPVAMVCVATIVALVAWAYTTVMPVAAERIAARIPIETEMVLGEQTLDWLDSNAVLTLSELNREDKHRIVNEFDKIVSGLPVNEHFRLAFRNAPNFGANAIALPGGTIVVTDELIGMAENDEEVLAILAHEIGHVERRHALRHVLHDSAIAVIASALTADAASLGVAVAGLPAMLTTLQFSREFETEADDFGFSLMVENGISPIHFANMMERMVESMPPESEWDQQWAFLSTHPLSDERIARARDAAAGFEKARQVDR